MVKIRGILSQENRGSNKLSEFVAFLVHFRIKYKNCDHFREFQRRILKII